MQELRLFGHHGVGEQERQVGSEFRVSVSALVRVSSAALEDDSLEGTVDYGEVCELVKQEFSRSSHLIENVAWRIAKRLLKRFALMASVRVRVEKLAPPVGANCRSAAVDLSVDRE